MQVHPVVIASGLLSASILGAAFGPRLLPERTVEAAPAAQVCSQSMGFYKPGLEQLNAHENAWSAFQEEVVAREYDQGNQFLALDFEATETGVFFYYIFQSC